MLQASELLRLIQRLCQWAACIQLLTRHSVHTQCFNRASATTNSEHGQHTAAALHNCSTAPSLLGRCCMTSTSVATASICLLLQCCHVGQAAVALIKVQPIAHHKLIGALHTQRHRTAGVVRGLCQRTFKAASRFFATVLELVVMLSGTRSKVHHSSR
jgi:hypothetical protein